MNIVSVLMWNKLLLCIVVFLQACGAASYQPTTPVALVPLEKTEKIVVRVENPELKKELAILKESNIYLVTDDLNTKNTIFLFELVHRPVSGILELLNFMAEGYFNLISFGLFPVTSYEKIDFRYILNIDGDEILYEYTLGSEVKTSNLNYVTNLFRNEEQYFGWALSNAHEQQYNNWHR